MTRGFANGKGRSLRDLSGCRAKVDRSREHLQALHDEIAGTSYTAEFASEEDPFGNINIVVTQIDETPIRWGTLIGDVVHNARSSLDHLACALNRERGDNCEDPQTAFPILFEPKGHAWDDRAAWDRRWQNRGPSLGSIAQEDRDAIFAVQPFHAFWPNRDSQVVRHHPACCS
jgi:hypothetical protein